MANSQMSPALQCSIPRPSSLAAPPGPDSVWLADPALGAPHDPLRFLCNLARDFGDAVFYSTLYGPVYFFNHPDFVRQVLHRTNIVRAPLVSLVLGQGLLSSDGDYWRSQRRLMQPTFHESCLAAFEPVITGSIQTLLARWDGAAASGTFLDVAQEMKLLTLDVVARAMFSADLSGEAEAICEAIGTLVEDLGFISSTLLNSPMKISPQRNSRF